MWKIIGRTNASCTRIATISNKRGNANGKTRWISLIMQPSHLWLVVGPPLWKIWKWIGMISNPIYGKITLMFQTTNQGCSVEDSGLFLGAQCFGFQVLVLHEGMTIKAETNWPTSGHFTRMSTSNTRLREDRLPWHFFFFKQPWHWMRFIDTPYKPTGQTRNSLTVRSSPISGAAGATGTTGATGSRNSWRWWFLSPGRKQTVGCVFPNWTTV